MNPISCLKLEKAYQALIEARAPFPPEPVPAGFPPHGHITHSPVAASTGPGPSTPEPPIKGEAAIMMKEL
jgi:hypothetical protein